MSWTKELTADWTIDWVTSFIEKDGAPPTPPTSFTRITEISDRRITENGDIRITEGV
jgi:hypothetical protein